jgi:hypothetical protein
MLAGASVRATARDIAEYFIIFPAEMTFSAPSFMGAFIFISYSSFIRQKRAR